MGSSIVSKLLKKTAEVHYAPGDIVDAREVCDYDSFIRLHKKAGDPPYRVKLLNKSGIFITHTPGTWWDAEILLDRAPIDGPIPHTKVRVYQKHIQDRVQMELELGDS